MDARTWLAVGKRVARRVALSGVTLALVSIAIFAATELLPGDVATALLKREATPEALAALRAQLHLDRPPLARYREWLSELAHGDLGVSLARQQPVASLVAPRLRNTLLLAAMACALGLPLAIALGVLAGLKRDGPLDLAVSAVALVGMSVPEFVTATLLVLAFAIAWPLFPAVVTAGPAASLAHLARGGVLPALTLAIGMVGYVARMVRTAVIDAMASEHVQAALLRGLTWRAVVVRHALPGALAPTLTAVALTAAGLVSGVVVVETVFNYPGLGRLLVTAVADRDLPVVQALGLLGAATYVGAHLAAELAGLALDPRVGDR